MTNGELFKTCGVFKANALFILFIQEMLKRNETFLDTMIDANIRPKVGMLFRSFVNRTERLRILLAPLRG